MNTHVNLPLIAAIAAELEPYRDDQEAFLDTLDGETNVLDILDGLLASKLDDDALAEAMKAQEQALRARRERVEMRADAKRRLLGQVLNAAGLRSAERPRGTVSLRPGALSVRIVNEADVPTQLCTVKTVTAPDKKAIRAQIEAGDTVPGAELVRGEDTISIRVS